MGAIVGSLNTVWHCLSLGLECKLTFSSSVATAEFSKFAGILSEALSQHYLRIWKSSTRIPSPALALFVDFYYFWNKTRLEIRSVQFSCSVVSTFCNPMNHSTPGFPVHHQLPEFTQTHVHWVGDAIQPYHPRRSPCPPAPNPFQHQGLFQWVNSSHEVAKVLEFQIQHQSFQWTPRTDLLWNGLVGSLYSPTDSQESSPTPQFKSINYLALSFLHSPNLTSIHDHWKTHSLD